MDGVLSSSGLRAAKEQNPVGADLSFMLDHELRQCENMIPYFQYFKQLSVQV